MWSGGDGVGARGSRCDMGREAVLLAVMAMGALQRGVGGGSALQRGHGRRC